MSEQENSMKREPLKQQGNPGRNLQAELDAVSAKVDKLADAVLGLVGKLSAAPAAAPYVNRDPDLPMTPYPQNATEKTQQKLERVDRELAEKKAFLEEGPKKFRVCVSNCEGMTAVVGANDKLYADAKYRSYFGITGMLDPRVRVDVEEIAEPAIA